jgi:hypothetical protein
VKRSDWKLPSIPVKGKHGRAQKSEHAALECYFTLLANHSLAAAAMVDTPQNSTSPPEK